MQHAPRVRGGEAGADLAGDLHRLVGRKPADAADEVGEVLAPDVLHRDEVLAVHLADVVHAAHVGVRDLACDPDLVQEPREARRVHGQPFGQELEGDRLPQLQVVGAVDLSHSPLAQQLHDAVAPAEDGAGQEAAVIDRVEVGGRRADGDGARPLEGRALGNVHRRPARAAEARFGIDRMRARRAGGHQASPILSRPAQHRRAGSPPPASRPGPPPNMASASDDSPSRCAQKYPPHPPTIDSVSR